MADNPFSVNVVNPMQALLLGQKAYGDAQEAQKQQTITDARSKAVQAYQAGDPKTALATLLGVGDTQAASALGNVIQQDWTRQHTTQRDAVGDQRWGAEFGLKKAAEGRAAADYENTPDQYAPNPNFGQPGQPKYIDQYAAARAAGEAQANGGQPEVGLAPAYGTDAAGNPAAIQFSKTGKAVQTQLPEGFRIAREPIKIDAGTHYNLMDPQTRQIVGTVPKNVAEVERQKVVGDEQGKAQVALPQVIATSQQILKTINEVKNHPGKEWSLGMYSKVPTVPGTSQAGFRTQLAQLQGQTFLQAYNTLKGGGAITDIEGVKATAALNRMNTVTTKEEFDKAADDFADVVKGGMLRAAAKARAPAGAGASQEQAAPNKPVVVDGYTIKEN